MSLAAVENAISNLANYMRLYVEAHMQFASLFDVDREEAIHNMERAFEAKLEAFHSLYDVSKDHFPYFDHGDTSALIALRNAIHHRDHPLFQGLLSDLWLRGDPIQWNGATYLLARHRMSSEGMLSMTAYFKLEDFNLRLDPESGSPHRDKFLKDKKALQRFHLIRDELGLDTIKQDAEAERYPVNQVYVDMMPVFVSAVVRVFKALDKVGANFRGFDAETYKTPFTSELEVDLKAIDYQPLKLNSISAQSAVKTKPRETRH
ncbi:hypothetical protein PARHAE_04033 [Paracoccus haematequi]|uniref:Uncharacterized protein n=1 Tax=Paracoccus haematequi TaxID=2491866 RepID=A0A3S4EUP8_9RHOB|nr:hypothetical protein [Paracoccus haematequi]VDS10814.1 hypothetical protein PARHAE_04033 [Paracoccus haematequi]